MEGVHRFLARSFRLVTGSNVRDVEPSKDQLRLLHATIKRVRCTGDHLREKCHLLYLIAYVAL